MSTKDYIKWAMILGGVALAAFSLYKVMNVEEEAEQTKDEVDALKSASQDSTDDEEGAD